MHALGSKFEVQCSRFNVRTSTQSLRPTASLFKMLICAANVCFLLAGCGITVYEPQARHSPPPPPAPAPRAEPWVDLTITVRERQVIQGYVATRCAEDEEEERKWHKRGKKHKPLPPGLAKKAARGEELPPGWEKKLMKRQVLPAEIYQRCHPLPKEVIAQLPPQPPGTILIAVGGKVARLLQATREILDVFEVEL